MKIFDGNERVNESFNVSNLMQMRICQEEDTPEASGYTSDVDTADCASDREQGKCHDMVKIITSQRFIPDIYLQIRKKSPWQPPNVRVVLVGNLATFLRRNFRRPSKYSLHHTRFLIKPQTLMQN